MKINALKSAVRKKIAVLRDALSKKDSPVMDRMIEKRILGLEEFKKARSVMFFASFRSEVNTFPAIRKALELKKHVVLPKVTGKKLALFEVSCLERNMTRGSYGIMEPRASCKKVNAKEIGLVFVPALAFDRKGGRIGYGGGYYDRFLKGIPLSKRIGLAYSFQVLERLPQKQHDLKVAKIITEKGVTIC